MIGWEADRRMGGVADRCVKRGEVDRRGGG
jgi:hypothetical protein